MAVQRFTKPFGASRGGYQNMNSGRKDWRKDKIDRFCDYCKGKGTLLINASRRLDILTGILLLREVNLL